MLHRALKITREFHKVRPSQLAADLNISKSYLSLIESGKKPVTLDIVEKYAQRFDIPASSLMFFAESMDGHKIPEKFKRMFAGKILKIMEWMTIVDGEDS